MYDPDTLGGEGGQFTWKLATGRVLGSVAHLEIKGTDLDMGDNEIILTAADKDGNTAEDSIAVKIEDNVSPDVAITNIEITPQQISQNDDLTYPDVQVSASLSNIRTDATARARLIVDGAFIQEKDLVIVANTITPVSFTWRPASTGNKTLRVEITNVEPSDQDLSNNALTKEVTVLSSDHTPPITSISSIPSGWTNQPVTITLTTTDTGGSGVDKTYYSLNGATPTLVYTGPITISNEGIYTVKYYSKDKAGNKETEKTASKQVKIDKTAPKGSIIINNGAASTTSPKITLRLSAKDSRSGMARGAQMRFSIDGSHWSTPVAYTASRILTLSSVKGTKKAYVRFKDVAGNWSIAYSAKIILR
jgi:DNA-binding protein